MASHEKSKLSLGKKFTPLSREEFAKATYGSHKQWFAKHYSLKLDKESDRKEADKLLDFMRNDPDFYTEEMLKRACGSSDSPTISENKPVKTANKEDVVPVSCFRFSSSFSEKTMSACNSLEAFRSDGVIVETPAQARAIQEDGPYGSPSTRTIHEDGNYSTPPSSRLSTVYEESSGNGGVSLSARASTNDKEEEDSEDEYEYDDDNDYHDVMGHEFVEDSYHNDYAGECDGSYGDF